MACSWRG